jgi:hypothetical protein
LRGVLPRLEGHPCRSAMSSRLWLPSETLRHPEASHELWSDAFRPKGWIEPRLPGCGLSLGSASADRPEGRTPGERRPFPVMLRQIG